MSNRSRYLLGPGHVARSEGRDPMKTSIGGWLDANGLTLEDLKHGGTW